MPGNDNPANRADPIKATYNPIFERFVPDDDQGNKIEGLVAYGLYKVAKREWAAEIWKSEKRSPTAQELAQYIQSWTPSRLAGLEEQANSALASFGDSVIQDATPGIREDALKGTLASAILTSMAGNFFYTLALVAAVLVLAWSGVDFLSYFEKIKPR